MKTFGLSARAAAIQPSMIRSVRAGMRPTTIDLGLGQTDLPVTQAVVEATRDALSGFLRAPYTPNAGSPEARRAVATHVGVDPEAVILTCGVQEGLAVALYGLCEEGAEVLVPDPGFPAYPNLVRSAGGRPISYPLRAPQAPGGPWRLSAQDVVDRITDKTTLVVLNQPSNPTGSIADPGELKELLEALKQRGILWISDEIYEDYLWSGQFCPARQVPGAGPGITLSGLSKSHHLMGWRLGWMVGPPDLIRGLIPLHQHLVTCAPEPAQRAAVVALSVHEEAVAETRSVLKKRRDLALESLDGLGVITAEAAAGAFYLFLDVRPWLKTFSTTAEMARALLAEEDVLVIPGEGFGEGALGHLRVAYTIGGDPLEEGLQRVRRFLQRTRGE